MHIEAEYSPALNSLGGLAIVQKTDDNYPVRYGSTRPRGQRVAKA